MLTEPLPRQSQDSPAFASRKFMPDSNRRFRLRLIRIIGKKNNKNDKSNKTNKNYKNNQNNKTNKNKAQAHGDLSNPCCSWEARCAKRCPARRR